MIFNIYRYDIGYRFLVWVFCYFKATLCTCRRVFLSFRLSAQDWDPNFDGRVTLSEVNKCVQATRAMCALVLNLMSNWTCFGYANVFLWTFFGGTVGEVSFPCFLWVLKRKRKNEYLHLCVPNSQKDVVEGCPIIADAGNWSFSELVLLHSIDKLLHMVEFDFRKQH